MSINWSLITEIRAAYIPKDMRVVAGTSGHEPLKSLVDDCFATLSNRYYLGLRNQLMPHRPIIKCANCVYIIHNLFKIN